MNSIGSPSSASAEASGLDIALFRDAHEDNVAALINQWYAAARANGEPPDQVQEDLIIEALSEYN